MFSPANETRQYSSVYIFPTFSGTLIIHYCVRSYCVNGSVFERFLRRWTLRLKGVAFWWNNCKRSLTARNFVLFTRKVLCRLYFRWSQTTLRYLRLSSLFLTLFFEQKLVSKKQHYVIAYCVRASSGLLFFSSPPLPFPPHTIPLLLVLPPQLNLCALVPSSNKLLFLRISITL